MIENLLQIQGARDVCTMKYSPGNVLTVSSGVKFEGNIVDMQTSGTLNISGNVVLPSLAGNTIPYLDINSKLKSTQVTPTELSALRGIAGPIQSQLDAHAYGNAVIQGAVSAYVTANMTPSVVVVTDTDGKICPSTATSTEVGYLHGVTTSVQDQLNSKGSVITGAASSVVSVDLPPDVMVITDTYGKLFAGVPARNVGYLDGARSNIQAQLDLKSPVITGAASTVVTDDFPPDSVVITDSNGKLWPGISASALTYIENARSDIQTQIDSKGPAITGAGSTVVSDDFPPDSVVITDENGKLWPGISVSALSYIENARSDVQAQLDSKSRRITGAISELVSEDLEPETLLGTDEDGKIVSLGVTAAEAGYLAGLTEPIQDQLDSREGVVTGAVSSVLSRNLDPWSVPATDAFGKLENSGISYEELQTLFGARGNLQHQINERQLTVIGAGTELLFNDFTPHRVVHTNAEGKVYESNVTTNELWTLSGCRTNVQASLDSKQSVITGPATSILTGTLPHRRVLITDDDGKVSNSSVTSLELESLSGLRYNIQRQLDEHDYGNAVLTGAVSEYVTADMDPEVVVVTDADGKIFPSTVTVLELETLSGATGSIQMQLDALLASAGLGGSFGTVTADTVDTTTVNADIVNATTVDATTVNADSVNADTVNADTVNAVNLVATTVEVSESLAANVLTANALTADVGTADDPSISFSSGPTGLYMPGEDVLGISAGGVHRARFDASGLVVTGNVTSDYILGNGAFLTGVATTSGSTLDLSGNLSTLGNIKASANVIGNYILGNGAFLTGVATTSGSTLNLTGNLSTLGNVTASGNLIGSYVLGNGSLLTGVCTTTGTSLALTGNLSTLANVKASGNLIGSYVLGNGSLLTGVCTTTGTSLALSAGLSVGGTTSLRQITETLNAKTGATGVVVHDYTTGSIWYHTAPAANFTVNLINVPTTDARTINVTLMVAQGGTAYIPTDFQIDGVAQVLKWVSGSAPSGGTPAMTDVFTFTLVRTGGAWAGVFGQSVFFG